MRGDSCFAEVAAPAAGKLAEFCRNASPGLILVAGDKVGRGGEETPRFELAFELAARMVECELKDRIVVRSRRPFLSLCGVRLIGDDRFQDHRWEVRREALGGDRIAAWLEEPPDSCIGADVSEWLGNPRRADWRSIFGSRSDVVLLDLEKQLDIAEMRELNRAAKAKQCTVLSCAELRGPLGKCCFAYSYAELAMRIGLEHGIVFSDCAESIVVVAPGSAYRCGIFQNGRAERAVRLNNPSPSDERFDELGEF